MQKHGRDWLLVVSYVGTRSKIDCSSKVRMDVAAGRMPAVPGKRSWTQMQPVHAPAPAAAPNSFTSKDNAEDDKDKEDSSNKVLFEDAATPASSLSESS